MIALLRVVLVGFGLITLIVAVFILPNQAKAQIRAYLEKQGAYNITIKRNWWGGNRARYAYTVTYRDASNVFHNTTCVINASFLGDRTIYWRNGPPMGR